MFKWLKKVKLSTRILVLVSFVLVMMGIVCFYALIKIHILGVKITEITENEIPLTRVVARIVEFQLDQTMRFNGILQHGQLGNKEKFEQGIEDFLEAGERVDDLVKEGKKITINAIESFSNEGKRAELKRIELLFDRIEKLHGDYEHHNEQLFRYIEQQNIVRDPASSAAIPLQATDGYNLIEAFEVMEKETQQLKEQIEEILGVVDELTRQLTYETEVQQKEAFISLITLVLISLGTGITLSVFITINTVLPLKHSIQNITSGSKEFMNAAAQIASAGNSLASESEKQLLAIDETAQTIGSMNGLAKKNLVLSNEQRDLILKMHTMYELAHNTINKIVDCSQNVMEFEKNIGPILKTLNDDVIQVNLLATNATAEGLRSRETRGIALFSNEIKVLSRQSVKLTRKADEMAMNSSASVFQGLELAKSAQKNLGEMVDIVQQLLKICEEDVNVSQIWYDKINTSEQSIGQINDATQTNAATAEATAAASEELNAQAGSLLDIVASLSVLTGR